MSRGTLDPRTLDNHQEHHLGISPHPLDETPEGHRVHETQAAVTEEEAQEEAQEEDQEEAQEGDQVGAQAEARAETMTEDHLMEDHPAEDHPAEDHLAEDHPVEGHQENLLETPQKETNWGETTLGTMTNLTTRIQITIQRTMRTGAIPLHQGEAQPPQATTGTSSIPQCGGLIHPGQEPRAKECRKSATTPSVNAFMKPLRTQLVTYLDGRQSPLAPTCT